MHIISEKTLRDFWRRHAEAEPPLRAWARHTRKSKWFNFADLRKSFPHADLVGKCIIFNIGGNKYRLITVIHFEANRQKVYVRHVLTHREYGEGSLEGRLRMSIIESENDVYLALVKAFPLIPIESDQELDRAIAVIKSLLDKPALLPGEQSYLDVLSDLVEKYELAEHPMKPVPDGEMLRHLIEARGITEIEVSRTTEIPASTISGVLSANRRLTCAQISKLASYFCVDPTVFDFESRHGRPARVGRKRK